MKFIELTLANSSQPDTKVQVNVFNILTIAPVGLGSNVMSPTGYFISVKETPAQILALINPA